MPSSPPSPERLPTFHDIEDAAERLRGWAVRTPLLSSPLLNQELGATLLVKAEPLQRTGSFKFRGAFNRISRLNTAQKQAGVVAFSSGNHAQGVAHAAQLVGAPAVIVMPRDAPEVKIANTRAYGAEVVLYERDSESREAIGREIAADRGLTLVPPYDDPLIMAGQGTIGLETAEQLAEIGQTPDMVLSPCGGGGLIAGTSLAITHHLPEVPVYAVEPAGFDDTARSLATGEAQRNDPDARSICDALLAPTPGRLTFSVNRQTLAGGLVVDDDEVRAAMAVAFQALKLVVEPGGAVALAAALNAKVPIRGKTVVVVASGGNVDRAVFRETLN